NNKGYKGDWRPVSAGLDCFGCDGGSRTHIYLPGTAPIVQPSGDRRKQRLCPIELRHLPKGGVAGRASQESPVFRTKLWVKGVEISPFAATQRRNSSGGVAIIRCDPSRLILAEQLGCGA